MKGTVKKIGIPFAGYTLNNINEHLHVGTDPRFPTLHDALVYLSDGTKNGVRGQQHSAIIGLPPGEHVVGPEGSSIRNEMMIGDYLYDLSGIDLVLMKADWNEPLPATIVAGPAADQRTIFKLFFGLMYLAGVNVDLPKSKYAAFIMGYGSHVMCMQSKLDLGIQINIYGSGHFMAMMSELNGHGDDVLNMNLGMGANVEFQGCTLGGKLKIKALNTTSLSMKDTILLDSTAQYVNADKGARIFLENTITENDNWINVTTAKINNPDVLGPFVTQG